MTIGHLIEGRDASIIVCDARMRVGDAAALLAEKRIGALPVIEHGKVVGIFSERDLIYRLNDMGPSVLESYVGDIMTSPALSVEPETEVLSALSLMTKRRVRHLPVMREGAMIAFISIGDLVKYRIDKIQSEAEAMRTYIQTA